MWWPENTLRIRGLGAILGALALALTTGGCFQPLYGSRSPLGGPGVASALNAVQVEPIEAPNGTPVARLGVQVRNALIFELTGGGAAVNPTHKLKIDLSPVRTEIIEDITTGRPEVETFGIDATYSLTEIATNRVVVTGRTFSRVSYDIPGEQQRFAKARGLRDAEDRASKEIASSIQQRLASHFLAGT
ncbi:MAG: hypothetical protein HXY30_06810 [Pseudorhodoplanes sp.]|nr:hypothetical protein [Pseudorhodoplanes sp.]